MPKDLTYINLNEIVAKVDKLNLDKKDIYQRSFYYNTITNEVLKKLQPKIEYSGDELHNDFIGR